MYFLDLDKGARAPMTSHFSTTYEMQDSKKMQHHIVKTYINSLTTKTIDIQIISTRNNI